MRVLSSHCSSVAELVLAVATRSSYMFQAAIAANNHSSSSSSGDQQAEGEAEEQAGVSSSATTAAAGTLSFPPPSSQDAQRLQFSQSQTQAQRQRQQQGPGGPLLPPSQASMGWSQGSTLIPLPQSALKRRTMGSNSHSSGGLLTNNQRPILAQKQQPLQLRSPALSINSNSKSINSNAVAGGGPAGRRIVMAAKQPQAAGAASSGSPSAGTAAAASAVSGVGGAGKRAAKGVSNVKRTLWSQLTVGSSAEDAEEPAAAAGAAAAGAAAAVSHKGALPAESDQLMGVEDCELQPKGQAATGAKGSREKRARSRSGGAKKPARR